MNLKHHRLKPGGVSDVVGPESSSEIEGPPAKPGGVSDVVGSSSEIDEPPAKAWWCQTASDVTSAR